MTEITEKTVREIAVECPATVRVFETLGIDYCCGGRKSLRDACLSADVPLERVEKLLADARVRETGDDSVWNTATLDTLTTHIVQKHHGYVRQEVPRLKALLAKVIDRHGATHPEIGQVDSLFATVAQELGTHMLKEEQVLFPHIDRLSAAYRDHQQPPPAFFGSVERPIANMVADHDDAGAVLAEMRRLSNGYAAPEGACPTFRALYDGLEGFERDLHQHIHLENNILFPRSIELERGGR